MDRRRSDLDDTVTVVGCTLFSHITGTRRGAFSLFIFDFSNMPNWTVDSHNEAHKTDLAIVSVGSGVKDAE